MATAESLTAKLISKLDATHVEIEDLSGGCGQFLEAIIVSPQFIGKKSTLARHRLVNAAIKEEVAAVHAWTPKCFTPEEWEKKRPQQPAPGVPNDKPMSDATNASGDVQPQA
ncbi:MAG: hypothetical protein M1814_004067 [Vezdaea aestivalis]|nr:MAG: hypothetical protein M1814_004067 [Vezdaea aestivalis]